MKKIYIFIVKLKKNDTLVLKLTKKSINFVVFGNGLNNNNWKEILKTGVGLRMGVRGGGGLLLLWGPSRLDGTWAVWAHATLRSAI